MVKSVEYILFKSQHGASTDFLFELNVPKIYIFDFYV